MSIEITVPRLGWSMDEGTFGGWLKAEGDLVREGDALFDIEGDKATQSIESFDAGILRISADGPKAGDTVKVGQVLGHLEPRTGQRGESTATASATTQDVAAASGSTSRPVVAAPSTRVPAPTNPSSAATAASKSSPCPPTPVERDLPAGHTLASPALRRLARELGVDLHAIAHGDKYQVSAAEIMHAAIGKSAQAGEPLPGTANRSTDSPVTPRAKRVAGELGVDVRNIVGSGKNGRIREADVRQAVANQSNGDARSQPRREPTQSGETPTPLRRVIAQRMMAASHETAPVTLIAHADASELVRLRAECKRAGEAGGVTAPSYTELLVKLSASALVEHPALLNQWIDDQIVAPDGVHIAVAVDTPYGLMTPVVRDVPSLGLHQLALAMKELIELARTRQLSVEQLQGGAFTVSSLGGYRVEEFTPILNRPQTAILGVGRITKQPVVRDDQLAIGHRVALSLTFDHRVVDGAPAAAFLTSLCEKIEAPLGWLVM